MGKGQCQAQFQCGEAVLVALASRKSIRGEFHHSDAHFESVAYATTLCSFQRWKNPKCPWPESITLFEQLSEAVWEPMVGAALPRC